MLNSTTILLPAGKVLTVTADALSSGSVVRLLDDGGSGPPIAISPSNSMAFGAFTGNRRYSINTDVGALVVSVDDPVQTQVADAVAITAVTFPAGGVGTAAGGWDTAVNRDLAIARFNALLADVTALRVTVNALLVQARISGEIIP
jgi:hypothetical protein